MSSLQSRKENFRPSHNSGLKSVQTSYPNRNQEPANQEPYFVNETLHQNLCEIHNRALTFYRGLCDSYSTLKLGPITIEVLRRITDNDLAEIEQKVYSDIEGTLAKLKIENEILLNNLSTGMDEPLNKFKKSVEINLAHLQRVRQSQPELTLDISNYSIVNGEILFSDLNKQRIREKYCVIYIDNPQKAHFVEVAENIMKGLIELKAILARNNIKSLFGYAQTFEILEDAQNQTIHYNKDILKQINN